MEEDRDEMGVETRPKGRWSATVMHWSERCESERVMRNGCK